MALVALIGFLYLVRNVLTYLVLGLVISLICEPIVNFIGRFKVKGRSLPMGIRALVAMLLFITFLSSIVWVFFPLIQEEYRILQGVEIEAVKQKVMEEIPALQRFNVEGGYHGIHMEGVDPMGSFAKPENIAGMISQLFGFLGGILAGFFATMFIAFFFLKDGSLFPKMIHAWVPEQRIRQVNEMMDHIHVLLRRYFIGVLLQSVAVFMLLSVSLSLCGVNNALVIALFAAMVNPIPYAGPIVAMAFGLFAAITTGFQQGPDMDIAMVSIRVFLCFIGTQLLDAFLIQPNLLGNSVKAHPLEIFIVILVFGTLGGITGMLLAIPVYTILRVVAKEFLSEYKVVRELTDHLNEN